MRVGSNPRLVNKETVKFFRYRVGWGFVTPGEARTRVAKIKEAQLSKSVAEVSHRGINVVHKGV